LPLRDAIDNWNAIARALAEKPRNRRLQTAPHNQIQTS